MICDWLKNIIQKHHWKVLNLCCILLFCWQTSGILSEWVHPSKTITRTTKKKLDKIEFPILFKICLNPGLNQTAIQEEGYLFDINYFTGESKFNGSLYGWAGHTNTSEARSTVAEVYQKIQNFPTPESFLEL